MKTRYAQNPPWADRIITRYWDVLKKVAPEGVMPDPEGLPIEQFRELGCGAFGCVYPTDVEDLVFKLTTDRTEAEFVSFAIDDPMPGLVPYFAVYEFPPSDVTHYNRTVFAIWRAKAEEVGKVIQEGSVLEDLYGEEDLSLFREALELFLNYSEQVDYFFNDAARRGGARAAVLDLQRGIEEMEGEEEEDFVDDAQEAGAAFWRAVQAIDLMKDTDSGRAVGEALEEYWREGLLLTDLHEGNFGMIDGTIVITDPGGVVPLDTQLISVEVVRLPRPRREAAN